MFTMDELKILVRQPEFYSALRVFILLAAGFPGLWLLRSGLDRVTRDRLTPQTRMVLGNFLFYLGSFTLAMMVLHELGFKLEALLGAAGIVGVAVGFASQTSLSNLISGIFLIGERPFEVGDVISTNSVTGIVLSVDLLSVKLRTFDNRFVRIPNETLIKSEVTNITRFPIRRIDITIGVGYGEDLRRVMALLREIADKNPLCLDEPEPTLLFTRFGDSSLEILFGVWATKEDFLAVQQGLMLEIKERFDAEGIEIPFPQRSVHLEATTPLPVRVVQES